MSRRSRPKRARQTRRSERLRLDTFSVLSTWDELSPTSADQGNHFPGDLQINCWEQIDALGPIAKGGSGTPAAAVFSTRSQSKRRHASSRGPLLAGATCTSWYRPRNRLRSGKESWPRPTSRLSSRRYGGGKATLLMASTIDATHLLLDLGLFGAAMSGVWN
jgi:hypothetical protein